MLVIVLFPWKDFVQLFCTDMISEIYKSRTNNGQSKTKVIYHFYMKMENKKIALKIKKVFEFFNLF